MNLFMPHGSLNLRDRFLQAWWMNPSSYCRKDRQVKGLCQQPEDPSNCDSVVHWHVKSENPARWYSGISQFPSNASASSETWEF